MFIFLLLLDSHRVKFGKNLVAIATIPFAQIMIANATKKLNFGFNEGKIIETIDRRVGRRIEILYVCFLQNRIRSYKNEGNFPHLVRRTLCSLYKT